MTLPTKTSLVALAFAAGAALMLPASSFSQKPLSAPTDRDLDLYQKIKVLEYKLGQQAARLDAQDARLAEQQKSLADAYARLNARPKGYAAAFITLGNLSRLPPTDGISYWARMSN